jgi:hypothetical protein
MRLRLERAGITCYFANEYTARFNRSPLGGIWIQVASSDAERAEALLAQNSDELSEIDADVLEAAADVGDRCPECGSDGVEYASGAGNTILGICQRCHQQWTMD